MAAVRVLIADDHPVFRFGLRALLDAESDDLQVVGEAATGEEAIAMSEALGPDVVLMDLNMPGLKGTEAAGRILQTQPGVGILVLTMLEDDESVFAAMRAGARGYLLKGASGPETLQAIHTIAVGGAIFSPAVAQHMLRFFAAPPAGLAARGRIFPELTEREREVLRLIAQGYTNTSIAEQLVLSPKTVRNYVSEIFSKLQVASRAQAVIRAREAGLGESKGD